MIPPRRSRILYRFFIFFDVLVLLAILYVLSIGPAMRWVMSAICGQAATVGNVARYEARFATFRKFYAPIFRVAIFLRKYKGWYGDWFLDEYARRFELPPHAADGRIIIQWWGTRSSKPPTRHEMLDDRLPSHFVGPRPRMEVFPLKRHNCFVMISDDAATPRDAPEFFYGGNWSGFVIGYDLLTPDTPFGERNPLD